MSTYAILPLVCAILAFALGFFVFLKNPKSSINRSFGLLCFETFWWQTCWFISYYLTTDAQKDIIIRIAWTLIIFLPFTHYHFTVRFLNLRKESIWIRRFYFLCVFWLIVLWTSKFFIAGYRQFPWGYYTKAGPLHPIYLIFVLSALICTWRLLKKSIADVTRSAIARNQSKFLFWAISLYFLTATEYFINYGVNFYPIGVLFILVSFSIIAYAIIRYHLLEIEVVIRKTLVFAGLFTSISAVFIGTAYLSQSYLTPVFGSKYFGMAIAVFIIILVQEPLKKILIKHTDRFLLQKKYDYQKVLRDASEGMSTVRELKWLLGLMTHIVSSKMRVSNIGIFLQEDELNTEHYFLKAKRGKEPIQPEALSKDNPICLWLKENKNPIVLEEIDYLLQRKEKSTANPQLRNMLIRIKNQMQSLNAKVIIPAFYKHGLLGFLSLGYKLSGDVYTKDDLTLLYTLSSSAAVAIENARLFDSLLDEIEINNHLRKEEEDSYMQMMMSLAKTIDAKDSYTYDHVEMVYQYGVDLAGYLPGVNKDALKASLRLHDLGKIGVPDSILSKQGPLDAEEWKKIKEHTVLGARILSPLKKFAYVAKIILHHQEKFDGTGYPAGLKGEQIPIESRIISVVDAYHAMISDRPYRKALPRETAVAELKKYSGTQFDPIVVEAFLKLLSEKYGVTAS